MKDLEHAEILRIHPNISIVSVIPLYPVNRTKFELQILCINEILYVRAFVFILVHFPLSKTRLTYVAPVTFIIYH
jgi:hypothetical protein